MIGSTIVVHANRAATAIREEVPVQNRAELEFDRSRKTISRPVCFGESLHLRLQCDRARHGLPTSRRVGCHHCAVRLTRQLDQRASVFLPIGMALSAKNLFAPRNRQRSLSFSRGMRASSANRALRLRPNTQKTMPANAATRSKRNIAIAIVISFNPSAVMSASYCVQTRAMPPTQLICASRKSRELQ